MLPDGKRRVETAELPLPPPLSSEHSLFLDFDGTLTELAPRPDAVIVGPQLIALLEALSRRMEGRVAIVTGRSIAQIDALLGPIAGTLAIAGSHGAERRTPASGHIRPDAEGSLGAATKAIAAFAAARPGMVFEAKSFGAGLHYRAVPEYAGEADAFAAAIATEHGLLHQHGKMMAEVRVAGDKGAALSALIGSAPFAGSPPLFFGDDVTDEDGFAAAAVHGGAGVLIGDARPTAATYRLDGVAAMLDWLAAGVAP